MTGAAGPSFPIGVAIGEDFLGRETGTGGLFTGAHLSEHIIWRRSASELDQLDAQVLLKRAARTCGTGGQLVAYVIRDIGDSNGSHACIVQRVLAR